ncbi:MAG TPA: phosphoribosylformylglycinamidine synthase subunit PurQ [Bacteroidales bacterium]|nr:phosphoribosylformylglycinamidine synthase subunit PurQ [Bacteroidales bacterium]
MKFGVVVFPGSNCDHDMVYVLKKLLKREVVTLWHKDTSLQDCDMVILPGGFSFGDYLRSGAIARFSPIMEQVIGFANKGGLVLGICNGFQILCEAQLLPGALLHNNNHRFICRNTYIRTETKKTIFTSGLNVGQVLKIPIAHGEGRYFAPDDVLYNMNKKDQILFRYCNESGLPTEDANPNGSIQNIAGVCNVKRNVFGMMPHPERAADPELGNTDGRILFDSVVGMLAKSGA